MNQIKKWRKGGKSAKNQERVSEARLWRWENKENSVLVKAVMGDGDGLNRSYSKCTSYYQVTKEWLDYHSHDAKLFTKLKSLK